MSLKTSHRGPNQKDLVLFTDDKISVIRKAANDYLWLLNHNYPTNASLKIVGDKYTMHQRQRAAMARSICSDNQKHLIESRLAKSIQGQHIFVDGFNTIITLEAMVCKAPVLLCSDGTLRDMSGVHGSYHKIVETPEVVTLIAKAVQQLNPKTLTFFFDRPVSNSGRLAALTKNIGDSNNVKWQCLTTDETDKQLLNQRGIVITSDSGILKNCSQWFNLTSYIKETFNIDGWFIDLTI